MAAVMDQPVTTARFKVVTPLVIIPDETQGQIYLYLDQYLPAHAPESVVSHLLANHCVVAE